MDRLDFPFELKFADAGSTGVFEGYGSVFNRTDAHGDVILPGAFTDTLAEYKARGAMPGLYAELSPYITAGDPLPVGVWTSMEQDDHGLRVKGKISALDTDNGRRIRSLMMDGAIGGLSIAYQVPPGGAVLGTKPGEPKRTIKSIILRSVDIVRDPSNAEARVHSVKSANEVTSSRDFEEFLPSSGFAKAAARKLVSGGWPALKPGDDTNDEFFQQIATAIKASARRLRGA